MIGVVNDKPDDLAGVVVSADALAADKELADERVDGLGELRESARTAWTGSASGPTS